MKEIKISAKQWLKESTMESLISCMEDDYDDIYPIDLNDFSKMLDEKLSHVVVSNRPHYRFVKRIEEDERD